MLTDGIAQSLTATAKSVSRGNAVRALVALTAEVARRQPNLL